MTTGAVGEENGKSKPKVFICYSRKDQTFADRLEIALKARGFEPLIDRTGSTRWRNGGRASKR
jgi:hypothetical protein